MKINLKLMHNDAEIIQSYLPNLNIGIQINKLSYFDGKRALCHWHEDIELVKITSGEMNYYVNGETVHLKNGDGIIVNARAMHYGYSVNNQDCDFICVLISPSIFASNHMLIEQLISPIINQTNLSYIHLFSKNIEHQYLLNDIDKFGALYISYQQGSHIELDCLSVASLFWKKWFDLVKLQLQAGPINESKDISIQKKMVNFIRQNYMNKITIEDIAQSANICRSRCCQYFQKYTQQSPMQFVINYRIKIAKDMMETRTMKITDIALSCGFNNLSYFSKKFYKLTGVTPKKYQENLMKRYFDK